MAKVLKLELINSIQVGPLSTVLADGTIVNPLPYNGANVTLDDGRQVQVALPLTLARLQAALAAAVMPPVTVGAITEGDIIV